MICFDPADIRVSLVDLTTALPDNLKLILIKEGERSWNWC